MSGEGVNFSRHNLLFRLKVVLEFLLPAGAWWLTLDPIKRPKQYIIEKSDFTMPSKRRLSDAFTLAQLLVAIVIIGLVAGLAVVPVLGKARESSGDRAKCMSNMRQISSVYQKDVEIYKKLSCSKALAAIGNSKGSDQSAE